METEPTTIEEVQAEISRLAGEIAIRQAEIRRCELLGHDIVQRTIQEGIDGNT